MYLKDSYLASDIADLDKSKSLVRSLAVFANLASRFYINPNHFFLSSAFLSAQHVSNDFIGFDCVFDDRNPGQEIHGLADI